MTPAGSAGLRFAARLVLAGFLLFAGLSHLTFARSDFAAQVPDWVPVSTDVVVVVSGIAELALGAALLVARRHLPLVGLVTGLFFIAVFPGNISQWIDGDDAFGLNSDRARFIRLFFQPVLIAWAWWSTGAWSTYVRRRSLSAAAESGA